MQCCFFNYGFVLRCTIFKMVIKHLRLSLDKFYLLQLYFFFKDYFMYVSVLPAFMYIWHVYEVPEERPERVSDPY